MVQFFLLLLQNKPVQWLWHQAATGSKCECECIKMVNLNHFKTRKKKSTEMYIFQALVKTLLISNGQGFFSIFSNFQGT